MTRRRKALIVAAVAALLVLLCLILCMRAAVLPRWQPSIGVYQGVDVVALENFVTEEGGKYVVRATAMQRFVRIPAWGGWQVSANITYSTLAVNLTDVGNRGLILIFGVASRNATLDQDLGHGFRVHAHGGGGYIVYNDTLAGWCLRPPQNVDGVRVWLPASSCSLAVSFRITVEPALGHVLVNGVPVNVYNVEIRKVQGVLPGWLVYTNTSGTYHFTARP